MSMNQKVQYFRNDSSYCYLGRPASVPEWVSKECCPSIAPGGTQLRMGPHDEEPSDNGTMQLVLSNGQHFTVCAIGPHDEVLQEVARFGGEILKDKEIAPGVFQKRLRCQGPSPSQMAKNAQAKALGDKPPADQEEWIAVCFEGAHRILNEVTHEKKDVIARGGSIAAAENIAKLEDTLSRERTEKEMLQKKLADLENRNARDEKKEHVRLEAVATEEASKQQKARPPAPQRSAG